MSSKATSTAPLPAEPTAPAKGKDADEPPAAAPPAADGGSSTGGSSSSGSSGNNGNSSNDNGAVSDEGSSDSGSSRTGKGNPKGQGEAKAGNSGGSSNEGGDNSGTASNGNNANNNNDNGANGANGDGNSTGKDAGNNGDNDGNNNNSNNNNSGKGKANGKNNDDNINDNPNPTSNARQPDDNEATQDTVDDTAPADDNASPSEPVDDNSGDGTSEQSDGTVGSESADSPQNNVPQVDSGNKGGLSAGALIGIMLVATLLVVFIIAWVVRRKTSVLRCRRGRKSYRLNDEDNDLFTVGQPYYEDKGRFSRGSVAEPSTAVRPSSLYIDELEPVGGGYVPPTNPDMGYAPAHYPNMPYSPYTSPPPSAPPYAPPVSLRPMSRFGTPSPVKIHSPPPLPPEYTSRPTTPYTTEHFVDNGFSRQTYNNAVPYKY